jgi:hypothetical protein
MSRRWIIPPALPRQHIDNDPVKKAIKFPNTDALCVTHFLSKHQRMPPLIELPFPGMIIRKRRSHPLGPLDSPREVIVFPFPDAKGEEDAVSDLLGATLKTILANPKSLATVAAAVQAGMASIVKSFFKKKPKPITPDRVWTAAEIAGVIRIQTCMRRALAIRQRHVLWFRRQARSRITATLRIQTWGRTHVQRKRFMRLFRESRGAAIRIQGAWRGFSIRKYLRLRLAARTITRALARNYGGVLSMSYQFLMHERWVLANWDHATRLLQRITRGFLARREAARRRLAARKRLMCILLVQRVGRGFLARAEARRLRAHIEKLWKSALLIQTFMRFAAHQNHILKKMKVKRMAAHRIQMRGRLYLARLKKRRLKLKVQMMWDFWSPKYLVKPEILLLLKRTYYGVERRVSTIAIDDKAFYHSIGKKDGNSEVASMLLSIESKPPPVIVPAPDDDYKYRPLFVKYDPYKVGYISREEFLMGVTEMWEDSGTSFRRMVHPGPRL